MDLYSGAGLENFDSGDLKGIVVDGSVFVSANQQVPVSRIDSFVVSKGNYICSAQKKFAEMAQYTPQTK